MENMENKNKFIELLDNLGDLLTEKFKEEVKDKKLNNLIKKTEDLSSEISELINLENKSDEQNFTVKILANSILKLNRKFQKYILKEIGKADGKSK